MESLSRPRHRRKHSTTATNASSSSAYSSFSFKNPYDDVLLPKGGKAKFEAHEYAEIFSGLSSIPVLDLSGLNERVGPADIRSSKLDYSNIFGGFRDDDVPLPYEQLFNGALKKTKTRIPADVEPPFQQHGSVNSSGKTKESSGASDQSIDGINQQFNMAFNKTSQRNSDESNGKTHIAQLHAVSGFTHFVDETPLQNKEHNKPNPSMKREVSRTWSFSSGVEHIPFKGGITSENSHTPDKSSNVIGINLKSHTSKGAPPSSHTPSPNDSKYLRQSKLPSFASKDVGEYSPPLLDEELDENSVAAVSAAALKKAIEQAQQSINTAKMIMEKRKEGIRDGLKPSSKSRSKVKDKKETGINALKENNVSETDGILDSILPKFTRNDILNARKAKVGVVRENVESANDLGDAFTGVEKKFTLSCSQSDILHTEKEAELKNAGPAEPHGETMSFTGFVANAKCRTSNFDSGEVDTCIEQMETGNGTLEKREETVHQPEGLEIVSEMAESAKSTSQSRQGLEKIVDEAYKQCQTSFNHIGPKSIDEQLERVADRSGSTQEQEKIMHEGGENNLSVDKEICENRFVGHKESVCMEQLTVLKSEIHDLQNESQNLVEEDVMDQADMDKKPENVCELKDDGQDGTSSDEEENGMVLEDEHQWFESEMQLAEPVEEEISYLEPEIYQEEEDGIKVHAVNESEIVDEKLNHEHEEDGQYEIPDRHVDRPECEAAETLQIEIDNYCEVLTVEEMNDTHKEGGSEDLDKSELNGNNIDETADAHCNISDTISSDGCRDTTSALFTERQEPSDVDINNELQDYQADGRCCKENDSFSLGAKMCLAVEDDEVNDMPEIGSLCRCASEEKFTEGQSHSTFEDLSSDNQSEDVDLMDADREEIIFETANEIHNTAQEYASKINLKHSPEFHNVDDEAREFDDRSAKPMSERTSESDEESPLTNIIENIDEVSTQESQAFRENLKDDTSIEEGQDRLVMTSDEKEYVGEQSDGVHPKDKSGYSSSSSNCEPKEMHKSMEAEREAEKGEDMEKEKENRSRTCSTGQKDAQGNDQKIEANDHQQRIEAIKRGREREKDRLAVERAIREARERAFADARQRAMADAREKLEKASVETKTPVDKVSNEAKLRVERAAVERATAEARERALEKAMSQKTYAESRTQAEKYSAERFSSSSRNNGLKHSFSSSDLEKFDGAASESAQRRKARLERHQRIMERAAKALAEKNMRDILAQKEQAERNRLAESLDADIKRWATGKEGNLRALLSTLQYILGPDSGWQPVSLTEIITTAAVKKAYRKATLCVHPDKLQQRGASVQQKYICEKVFDLLKAAWNRFNSEER